MFKQCLTLSTLLCMVWLSGAGQYRPQDGFIIKNTGDTLFGKLRLDQRVPTPKSVHFIPFEGDRREVTYFPRDLRGFEILGFCAYISDEVEIDNRPVDVGTGLDINQQRTRKATVFLKKLIEGYRLNLYYYRDYKDHFFWRYSNADDILIREFDYGVGTKEESPEFVYFNNGYKRRLLDLAKEFQLHFMEAEILDATYEIGPLTSIVKRLNMLQSDIIYDASREGVLFPRAKGPYLMLGTGWTRLRHLSSSRPHLPYHVPASIPFVATLGKQVGPAFWRGKMAIKVEAMGYYGYYDVYTMDTIPTWGGEHLTDVSSAYLDISLALHVSYKPWPVAHFSPALTAGLQGIWTLSSYSAFNGNKSATLGHTDALVRPLRLAPMVKVGLPVFKDIAIVVGHIFHTKALYTDGSWFRPQSTFIGLALGDQ